VVVAPSNPYDAKGLLLSALQSADPVMVFEPKRVYRGPDHGTNWSAHPLGEVPEGHYTVEFGKASTVRELQGRGTPVSLVTYGAMVHTCAKAAELAEAEGIDVELIDLRSLVPLDLPALVASGLRTGRVVVANEAPRTCGFAAELLALIGEHCFDHLQAPPLRVTGWDTPFPYTLEAAYMPDPQRVLAALRKTASYR
jgi:2-oxoisovalerate dehydrogenase E1 component beta subunit